MYAGRVVRIQRVISGVSQGALATRVGIRRTRLAEFEGGHRDFPPDLVVRLLEALGDDA